eukprot:244140_1
MAALSYKRILTHGTKLVLDWKRITGLCHAHKHHRNKCCTIIRSPTETKSNLVIHGSTCRYAACDPIAWCQTVPSRRTKLSKLFQQYTLSAPSAYTAPKFINNQLKEERLYNLNQYYVGRSVYSTVITLCADQHQIYPHQWYNHFVSTYKATLTASEHYVSSKDILSDSAVNHCKCNCKTRNDPIGFVGISVETTIPHDHS